MPTLTVQSAMSSCRYYRGMARSRPHGRRHRPRGQVLRDSRARPRRAASAPIERTQRGLAVAIRLSLVHRAGHDRSHCGLEVRVSVKKVEQRDEALDRRLDILSVDCGICGARLVSAVDGRESGHGLLLGFRTRCRAVAVTNGTDRGECRRGNPRGCRGRSFRPRPIGRGPGPRSGRGRWPRDRRQDGAP